jgi:thiamine transport system ATP-binding protein
MLECRDLTVRFGAHLALAGVDLTVPSGAVVAVMGPSGCGKTTLLRVIAGLQRAATGSVAWDGEPVDTVPTHRRGFGMMFQDHALFPHRTVAGNVEFGLRMEGMAPPDRGRRVSEVLELVGLTGYDDRSVADLSGGEQQRVALARTLAPSPRLIMLDEPLGSLDRALRDRLIVEMRGIFAGLGITVVYVTHDQDEAFAVADRVAVMRAGTVEREGEPEELWRDPGTEFVARLLGAGAIVAAAGAGGRADLGWVTVPVDLPDGVHRVLVPAGAVTLDEAGPVSGDVVAAVYRRGGFDLRVAVGDDVLETRSPVRVPLGSPVRLRIDGTELVRLTS